MSLRGRAIPQTSWIRDLATAGVLNYVCRLQQVERAGREIGRVQGALEAHRRFRRHFEDDLGSPDGDQIPAPGDCTIA